MENISHGIWVPAVVAFTIFYFIIDRFLIKPKLKAATVCYDSAKEALNRISNWATWLVALQTAAMGSMLFLTNEKAVLSIDGRFFAFLFFGSSIVLSTWLLSSLPSIQQGLIKEEPSAHNDIYMADIFSFVPIRLSTFFVLVHSYFLIGVVSYALFFYEHFY